MSVYFTCCTPISAPPADVFAAAVSIDAHLNSMSASKEQAIAGVTTGRIGLGWVAERLALSWYLPWLIRCRNAYLKASIEA